MSKNFNLQVCLFCCRPHWVYCHPDSNFWSHDLIAEPANRATTIAVRSVLSHIEINLYRHGKSSRLILSERFKMFYIGLIFKPFSPFYEPVNILIWQLTACGLIDYWINNDFNPKRRTSILEDIGPQILTFEHLAIGFQVCLMPMFLSLVSITIEIGSKYFLKKYL